VTALPQDPATALPGWMDLPDGLSAEEYEALPEDICRRIEIVDGAIIVNATPRRLHQEDPLRLLLPARPHHGHLRVSWVHTSKMTVTEPVTITVDLTALL
jgi:hypothetical protein